MQPRIEILNEKKLVGIQMSMSLTNNRTGELWRGFMPRRKEIQNVIGNDLYALRLYDPLYFQNFDLNTEFVKWATIEVSSFDNLPSELETFILSKGLYAVFLYKGASSAGASFFQYIYSTWLPSSDYVLDNRPHFEILGEKYKNEDPNSEEEIWVPIKQKNKI